MVIHFSPNTLLKTSLKTPTNTKDLHSFTTTYPNTITNSHTHHLTKTVKISFKLKLLPNTAVIHFSQNWISKLFSKTPTNTKALYSFISRALNTFSHWQFNQLAATLKVFQKLKFLPTRTVIHFHQIQFSKLFSKTPTNTKALHTFTSRAPNTISHSHSHHLTTTLIISQKLKFLPNLL